MITKFYYKNELVEEKNLTVIPMRGDIITFTREEYYIVTRIIYHYDSDTIMINLNIA